MARMKASEKQQKAVEMFDNVRSEALDEIEKLTGNFTVDPKSGIQIRHRISYHGRPTRGTSSYVEVSGLLNCNASLQLVNFSKIFYAYCEVMMNHDDGRERILANNFVEFE